MTARTAVAMSGGGHRACVFALGALLQLAESGRTTSITSVASVSGGSLANGTVAQALDLTSASAAEVEAVVGRVARVIARRGTVFGARGVYVYLVSLLCVAALALVGPWLLPVAIGLCAVIFVLGVLVFAWWLGLRGSVTGQAFRATLFSGSAGGTPLRDMHDAVDHVICATDLHAGEHVLLEPLRLRVSVRPRDAR